MGIKLPMIKYKGTMHLMAALFILKQWEIVYVSVIKAGPKPTDNTRNLSKLVL